MTEKIPEISDLYLVTKEDYKKVYKCAERAFKEYPSFDFISGNGNGGRIAGLFYSVDVRYQRDGWIVLSTDSDVKCVAFFMPPFNKDLNNFKLLVHSLLKRPFRNKLGLTWRSLACVKAVKEVEKYGNEEDSWYLYVLMVDPDLQGKGLSKKIFMPMLDYMDRIGKKCYLETCSEDNVRMYKKYGFEITKEVEIKNGPKVYAMVRPPKQNKE